MKKLSASESNHLHEGIGPALEEIIDVDDVALDDVEDGGLDPVGGALEGEGAVLELVVELAALVVDAVVLDDRGDEAEAGVGGVDAHGVDAVEEELEDLAEGRGVLDRGQVRGAEDVEDRVGLLVGLLVAGRGLLAFGELADGWLIAGLSALADSWLIARLSALADS